MLISAHIHKFRSCEDIEINDFGDITAFIGRNGAGKTNILKAIEWAVRCLVDEQIPNDETDIEVTIFFRLGDDLYKYKVSKYHPLIFTEEMFVIKEGCDNLLFLREENYLEVFGVDKKLVINSNSLSSFVILTLFSDSKVSKIVGSIFYLMRSIIYIDFIDDPKLSNIISRKDFERWVVYNHGNCSSRDTLLKILQMCFHDRDLFNELSSLLGNNGLGLVSSIKIKDIDNEFFIVSFSSSEGQSFLLNELSFGTRRIVRLLTSMLYDKASIALIEQPEDGIHPGLLHKIIPLLRSYANPNQFIVTSHSPYILNRLKPEEIRMVYMKNGKTNIRVLNEKEIEIANDFIENEGALSEFIESIEER